MAHEIDFTTGLPAVAYTGRKPWHGFGTEMEEDLTLDEWRVAAGLDWNVESRCVQYNRYPSGERGKILSSYNSRKILLRSDTLDPLSCVSDRFKVVQPKEVMEFFESLIGGHSNVNINILVSASHTGEMCLYFRALFLQCQIDYWPPGCLTT